MQSQVKVEMKRSEIRLGQSSKVKSKARDNSEVENTKRSKKVRVKVTMKVR